MRRTGLFALITGLLLLVVAGPASAAPTSTDPTVAAVHTGRWLADQIGPQGYLAGGGGSPDWSTTMQAVPALVATGADPAVVDAVMAALAGNVDAAVRRDDTDQPGALAYLILAAVAAGDDPRAFGSPATDLVARLEDTMTDSGLFGSADATWDGVYRQGLSLLALAAAGVTPNDVTGPAAEWLVDQACDDGTWTAYRTDTAAPCPATDFAAGTLGAESNATAIAAHALHLYPLEGTAPMVRDAVDALQAARASGGWGMFLDVPRDVDPNSTAVVANALGVIVGPDAAARQAILGFQLGCDVDALDVAALTYDGEAPNLLATVQALTPLVGATVPVRPGGPGVDAAPACAPEQVTTTTTTVAGATTTTLPVTVRDQGLARTGSSDAVLALVGVSMVALGSLAMATGRRSWS